MLFHRQGQVTANAFTVLPLLRVLELSNMFTLTEERVALICFLDINMLEIQGGLLLVNAL